MIIKVCGITRLNDALAAVESGVDALGFVFWPKSPRFIDPYRARAIARRLPPFVTVVGLFVNQPLDYVRGVGALLPLSAVQLHGDETPSTAAAVRRPVLKAIGLRGDDTPDAQAWPAEVMWLLDAYDPARRGGTGQTIDWTRAAALACQRPVVLAGGLSPENVGEAIRTVRPAGVDVSSGVEDAPGIKNPARLAAFVAAARAAEAECRAQQERSA